MPVPLPVGNEGIIFLGRLSICPLTLFLMTRCLFNVDFSETCYSFRGQTSRGQMHFSAEACQSAVRHQTISFLLYFEVIRN